MLPTTDLPNTRRVRLLRAGCSFIGILGLAALGGAALRAETSRPALSADALETARSWLDGNVPEIGPPDAGQIVFGEGWRVYSFERLSDVMRGQFLRAAKPFSWSVPVMSGPEIRGLLQLSESPGAGVRITAFLAPVDPDYARALAAAGRLTPAAGGTFELRELRALEYRLRALWLHTPGENVFIPAGDGGTPEHPWRTGQPCTEAELASWLKPLAEELIRDQFGSR